MLHSSLYLLFIKNETKVFNWSQIWPLKENYFRLTLGSPTFICPSFRFVTHIALSWPSFPTHWSSVCSIKVFVKLDSDLRHLSTANVSMVTKSSLSKYSSHRKIDSKCSHFKVSKYCLPTDRFTMKTTLDIAANLALLVFFPLVLKRRRASKIPSKIRLDFLERKIASGQNEDRRSLSPAVHIYDFHIFTFIYSSLHGFITNQRNNQLSVGFLAQLAERCTGIAEAVVSRPVQAWSFQTLFLLLLK